MVLSCGVAVGVEIGYDADDAVLAFGIPKFCCSDEHPGIGVGVECR